MNLVGAGQWDLDAIKQTILDGLVKDDSAEFVVATQSGSTLKERSRIVIPTEWEDPFDQMINDDLDLLTITLVADEAFISKVEENLKDVGWSLEVCCIPDGDTWNLLFVLNEETEVQDD